MAADILQMEIVNVVLAALLFFPFMLVLMDSFFRVIFLTVAGFSKGRSKPDVKNEASNLRILILVLAHNEQHVITRTLNQIQSQIAGVPSVTLALLADNCTDATIELANQSGVRMFVRSDGDAGKGQALSWFASCFQCELGSYDLIAIIDADTKISTDFCQNLPLVFISSDIQVAQSFVEPVNENGPPIATLVAFSEILSQNIDDAARSRLGWSSPLRGTGMVFRRDVFLRVCLGLQTQVDDIELSLRLAERNILVAYCPQLKIFDPKSGKILGLAKQRGRWLKGQRDVWKGWQGKLNVLSGFSDWSLLHALLLRPKFALFVIKVILLSIFYFLDARLFVIPRFLVSLSLCVDFGYYLTGFWHVSEPRKYLFSFLSAPLLFAMWISGWFFSFGRRDQWLRARE